MLDHAYPENVEESGACLRLALKEIAGYNLCFDPITYAVFYEYAAGSNQALVQDITSAKKTDATVTRDIVREWYKTHIAGRQTVVTEQKSLELRAIISEISQHLGHSGSRLNQQGRHLTEYSQRLGHAESLAQAMDISQGIMSETQTMISDSNALKQEMDDTITEIHALKKELEGVKMEAKTDTLTGLLNRRGFEKAMARARIEADGSGQPMAILMADIDHFKRINDNHGHLIGDNVLKMLARVFQKHIKGQDTAARFGGEEFIIILPNTPLKGAFVLAEQIRMKLKSMRWKTKSGEDMGTITLSLGAAQYKPGETVEALIERTDNALYTAKSSGRDRTVTELDISQAQ